MAAGGPAGRSPRCGILAATLALAVALVADVVGAQVEIAPHDPLDFDRPEAWGMKYGAAVLAFTAVAPPRRLAPGEVELAVEGASVPSLSSEERRIGRNGTSVLELDRAPAFGRLRARFGLPRGFVAELGIVPPVELDGLEPRFAAVALAHAWRESRRLALVLRGQAQLGTLEGDLTCTAAAASAGDDAERNPLGCEAASRDELELALVGAELVASFRAGGARGVEPWLAIGLHHLDGTFRVDARYSGIRDRTRLTADGWIGSLALGAGGRLGEDWRLAGEVAYWPLDIRRPGRGVENEPVVNLRLVVAYRLR